MWKHFVILFIKFDIFLVSFLCYRFGMSEFVSTLLLRIFYHVIASIYLISDLLY
jgi:hypothetical protein